MESKSSAAESQGGEEIPSGFMELPDLLDGVEFAADSLTLAVLRSFRRTRQRIAESLGSPRRNRITQGPMLRMEGPEEPWFVPTSRLGVRPGPARVPQGLLGPPAEFRQDS